VAQQEKHENAPNKPVHLMFLCGAVFLFYILQWTIDWIWGYISLHTLPSEFKITLISAGITLVAGIVLYRSDKYYGIANEIAGELKKVTWPSAKEVRSSTVVVIVMSIIMAVILGFVYDGIWSNLTELVYG
jgi:preprotein translocase subunit SecE